MASSKILIIALLKMREKFVILEFFQELFFLFKT